MSYLSESSRTHFKEVLEYIESLEIPYTINHTLIGSRSYCSDTVFEITGTEKGKSEILAIGERYNGLAKKALGKKDIPSIGVALLLHPHFVSKRAKKEKIVAPKFFFIQLGFSAKLQSLKIMELLRQAGIPVEQSLSKDKLSLQLATAEKMNIPYIIMLGQKEAIEHSVVVREMKTMSQETVLMTELVSYLKKLP
jgi:histidyl-tRNA synthetase